MPRSMVFFEQSRTLLDKKRGTNYYYSQERITMARTDDETTVFHIALHRDDAEPFERLLIGRRRGGRRRDRCLYRFPRPHGADPEGADAHRTQRLGSDDDPCNHRAGIHGIRQRDAVERAVSVSAAESPDAADHGADVRQQEHAESGDAALVQRPARHRPWRQEGEYGAGSRRAAKADRHSRHLSRSGRCPHGENVPHARLDLIRQGGARQ